MSNGKLDISKFKKVDSNEKYTTLATAAGHRITLAHESLSPEFRKQLEGIPLIPKPKKMAEGGEAAQDKQDKKSYFDQIATGQTPLAGSTSAAAGKAAGDFAMGDQPAQGDEITPTSSPVDLIAGGIPAMAEAAPAVLGNEVGAIGNDLGVIRSGENTWMKALGSPAQRIMAKTGADKAANPMDALKILSDKLTSGEISNSDWLKAAPNLQRQAGMADGGEASSQDDQPVQDGNALDTSAKTQESTPSQDSSKQAPVVVNVNTNHNPQPAAQDQGVAYKLGQMAAQGFQLTPPGMGLAAGRAIAHAAPGVIANGVAGATGNPPVDMNGQAQVAQQPQAPLPPPPPSPDQQVQAAAPPSPADEIGPGGVGLTAKLLRQGIGEQEQGLKGEAAAAGAQGQAEASSAQQAQDNLQHVYQNYQKEFQDASTERMAMVKAIQDQHIDPKHYVQSMSTGSRIANAFGLILGGASAGTLGGENPALKVLQSNIDRDIDAQKAELGKKNNLLEANMQRFHNNEAAATMTKSMLNDMMAMRLKQIAGTNIGPMAQARAMQAAGALHANSAQLLGQAAWQEAMFKQMGQGGGPGHQSVDPALLVPMYIQNPEQQKEALGEIKSAQDTTGKTKDIMGAFDALQAKMSTLGGKATALVHSPREAAELEQLLTSTAEPLEGSVKAATVDAIHHNLMPLITDVNKDPAIRRKALADYLSSKSAAPRTKAYSRGIIDLAKFNSTDVRGATQKQLSPQEQTYLNWAKQNPGNPKAQAVLKKLGGS